MPTKVARVHPHKKEDGWHIEVPVSTIKRLGNVEFLGIGQHYQYKYKNGKTEKRWKLVESIAPNDNSFWFILHVSIDTMNNFKLAVMMDDKHMQYEWLTFKDLKISSSRSYPENLSILEIALIESEIENALGG